MFFYQFAITKIVPRWQGPIEKLNNALSGRFIQLKKAESRLTSINPQHFNDKNSRSQFGVHFFNIQTASQRFAFCYSSKQTTSKIAKRNWKCVFDIIHNSLGMKIIYIIYEKSTMSLIIRPTMRIPAIIHPRIFFISLLSVSVPSSSVRIVFLGK